VKTWSVCNQKGGVGKTTTAIAIGSLLASRGCRVLLVDLDPHASASAYLLGSAGRRGVGVTALFDAALEAGAGADFAAADVSACCEPTPQPNLSMLRAAPALAALERRSAGLEGVGRVLARALAALDGTVDDVVVDCPPTLGLLMVNAVAAADHVLIPVQTEHLALEGLKRMLATLAMVQRSQRRDIPRTVIPTLFDRRTRAGCLTLAQLRQDYADVLWDDAVPIDTRLRDAARAGQPGPLYSPDSRAVTAYRRLLDSLLDDAAQPAGALEVPAALLSVEDVAAEARCGD
jgi:chromosome partitioning protein